MPTYTVVADVARERRYTQFVGLPRMVIYSDTMHIASLVC